MKLSQNPTRRLSRKAMNGGGGSAYNKGAAKRNVSSLVFSKSPAGGSGAVVTGLNRRNVRVLPAFFETQATVLLVVSPLQIGAACGVFRDCPS